MNESTKVTMSLGLDEYDLLRALLIREDNRLNQLLYPGHFSEKRILAKMEMVGNLFDYLGEAYREACES